MLNLKEELSNYKPVLVMDEVESAVHKDELVDIMELLQHLRAQIPADKEK